MRIVILSGYFNPLHGGHLDMIEAAAAIGDHLIVIINNDKQQLLKKGKIILSEQNRARLIAALRAVDEVFISIDEKPPVIESLKAIRERYPKDELIFANGGDRKSEQVIPESTVCKQLNIKMLFGVGGNAKADSSTRINKLLGKQE